MLYIINVLKTCTYRHVICKEIFELSLNNIKTAFQSFRTGFSSSGLF